MRSLPLLAAVAVTTAAPAIARDLDPATPADAVEIVKRTQCGPADGEAATYRWHGRVYARRQGEPDKLIFRVEGMNIRQCGTVTDPQRGTGFRQVSREIMLYLDPDTGAILRRWDNPFTGQTVDVFHVANDPVNGRPNFPVGADGKPYQVNLDRIGEKAFLAFEAPLYYTNPLGGDYQDYVGNKYHAMEIFDFADQADDLLSTDTPTAYPAVSWVRISDWLPWMKMEGREGQLVFNAVGTKLKSFEELPAVVKDEIRASYPAYTAPPPLDDQRPNATTWTEFKRRLDERPKPETR